MKFLAVVAATMLTASSLVPVAAEAAPAPRHHGWKWTTKTVCKTRWHHGRKIRQCKKVRVRAHW